MEAPSPFGEVLDAVDRLPLEEQEILVDVLHRRIIEHRREQLASEILQAQQEFREGRCQPIIPEALMKEFLGMQRRVRVADRF